MILFIRPTPREPPAFSSPQSCLWWFQFRLHLPQKHSGILGTGLATFRENSEEVVHLSLEEEETRSRQEVTLIAHSLDLH